ncbi:Os03g0358700 [Oryza sativa Japonica Group]|uniref:Os03g0358700 protein n=2 Tax=Oryza sativa subsp. japonica TaxID=39947 RepID=Q0DRS7_ORYSJ|nr:hypothetical protein EE612_017510 [Oryza sativa]BAF12061.1 Os03g0358700 [Oryza sativa Japonica Group]BAS84265.1 Os03g0358700 [Oryza sativa Japonica Group]|eukprot:NP_001050147.1 Os03g0358700 [Oryza sativa Japonica Group]
MAVRGSHHPDERVARRLQPEAELHRLLLLRVHDAPEADVDDGAGLLAVEPPEALVGADGGGVPPRRQRRGAPVVERDRPDSPELHPPGLRVAGDVLRLHLEDGVDDDAVGLRAGALQVVGELLPPGDVAEEARGLRPRDLDPPRQAGHHHRRVVVGDAVVGAEPLDVVLAEEAEGAHAEEGEPRDGEAGGELRRPRVAEVRHDARRGRRAPLVRAEEEVALDGLAEARHGGEVARHELGGDVVHVVHALRQAGAGVVERELGEADGQAGPPGRVDGGAHPRRRGRRGDDGAERAVGGEQQRGVHRRYEVALRHERDEHEVRRRHRC